jgi:hypothetical protein
MLTLATSLIELRLVALRRGVPVGERREYRIAPANIPRVGIDHRGRALVKRRHAAERN